MTCCKIELQLLDICLKFASRLILGLQHVNRQDIATSSWIPVSAKASATVRTQGIARPQDKRGSSERLNSRQAAVPIVTVGSLEICSVSQYFTCLKAGRNKLQQELALGRGSWRGRVSQKIGEVRTVRTVSWL